MLCVFIYVINIILWLWSLYWLAMHAYMRSFTYHNQTKRIFAIQNQILPFFCLLLNESLLFSRLSCAYTRTTAQSFTFFFFVALWRWLILCLFCGFLQIGPKKRKTPIVRIYITKEREKQSYGCWHRYMKCKHWEDRSH